MITSLPATTTDEIVAALIGMDGVVGGSRVLTLVISTDEAGLDEALLAAHGASRDHPCRVLAVVYPDLTEGLGGADRLDAEIRLGHDTGAGETIVLRPRGAVAGHVDTLVVPFLLPDVPVVAWWPGVMPPCPAKDPIGRLAGTRITNSPAQPDPVAALAEAAPGYTRGDIDLAWTRMTLWRATVASTLDPLLRRASAGGEAAAGSGAALRVEVAGEADNASMALMIRWLRLRLGAEVATVPLPGFSGISYVSVHAADGEYRIERTDQERVRVSTPSLTQPQIVTMPRREPITTLTEELRRLAPDPVFEEVLAAFAADYGCTLPSCPSTLKDPS